MMDAQELAQKIIDIAEKAFHSQWQKWEGEWQYEANKALGDIRKVCQEQLEPLVNPTPTLTDVIADLQRRIEKLEQAPAYPVPCPMPYYPPAILPGVYPPTTYLPQWQKLEVGCKSSTDGKE